MPAPKIRATTTFLHGTKRFEQGQTYSVAPADADLFVTQGWATRASGRNKTPQDIVLEVHDVDQASDTEGP